MPDYTQLQLSNIALNMAGGRSTIRSLDENSNEARNCALIFSKITREVLATLPWDFALTTKKLEYITNGGLVPVQWLGAWARPDDAIRILYIREGGRGVSQIPFFSGSVGQSCGISRSAPFALGNIGGVRCIFANAREPQLTYIAWQPDFAIWSDDAIELLTTKLAVKLAIPIAQDKGLFDRLSQECRVLESRFRAANANETIDTHDVPTDWILARDGVDFTPTTINMPPITDISAASLPTTPPAGSGEFWNDGGLLAISQ